MHVIYSAPGQDAKGEYLHLIESHGIEVLLWHVDTANLALQTVIPNILLLQP